MTLAIGSRLGPYEIQSLLGAGGMGEVYRARDTRLNRTVAIKILPADRCASPEARQRFEREAATISQLAHPHICALYDVGSQPSPGGTIDYLVMEHLEGETLADRLEKGPLPLDQSLRCAIQIADALSKAHRHGVVHRDLKPANVMLTRSGVKLLDFGLAKSETPQAQAGTLTALPTRADLTQQGTILGTVPYMAPEQLEGKEADPRTDIFALGAVLYEMATGRRAFAGTSQASLISAIMKEHPAPMTQAQPTTPPALDHVVRTCLAKDPDERWQSAGDVRNQLAWIAEGGGRAPAAIGVPARRPGREWLAWGVAALAILAAGGVWLLGRSPAPASPGSRRFSIDLQEKSSVRAAVLSPDGSRIAIVARDARGQNLLWIRALESLVLQPLPGTENPSFPFWSPDGRFIGFFADGKLKKIAAAGGPPQSLCDAPINRGGSWGPDGTILMAPNPNTSIYRVPASGGQPVAVTRFDAQRSETSHRWPYFLPDGRHFLYLVASFAGTTTQERHGIYVGSLDGGDDRFLLQAKSSLAYAPPGYVLFLRERNLFAQPFDAGALRMTGDPFPLAERIQFFAQIYGALFSVSGNGTLLYQDETPTSVSQLVWFDRAGRKIGDVGQPGDQANPHISIDGKRVSVDITDPRTGNIDIWVHEAAGGVATRLTSHPAIDGGAVWSPDGKEIAFTSVRQGGNDLYRMGSGGGGEETPLMVSGRLKYPCDWSPDGRFLLFRAVDAQSNPELWVVPTRGEEQPAPFIKASYGVTNGQFSPDGRYVAYASNETGRWEIYVAPFPGPGGNWRVSSAGGSEPKWRRDGRELFYIAPDGTLTAVAVREGASFGADAPRPLFPIRRREPVSSLDLSSYDVAPDGQRFLVNTDTGATTSPPLTIVLDWPAGIGK
jgi:eukaryotic-like serine/threonine-protein kinase